MALNWRFRRGVLTVREIGLISNDEIERVILRGVLADPCCPSRLDVVWDATASESPMTSEDVEWRGHWMALLAEHGYVSRFAFVVRPEQHLTLELGERVVPSMVEPLDFRVFASEPQALAWLEGNGGGAAGVGG